MFNTTIDVKVNGPLRLGDEQLSVRWPTDAEWFARSRSKKYITRRLGRGKSETIPPDPNEADIKLFQAISLNGNPPLSEAEAAGILDAMMQSSALGVRIEDGQGVVQLTTVGGVVSHRLDIPTAEQIVTWRRAAFKSFELQYGQNEFRILMEPGTRLWDSCNGSSGDYTGPIPAPHKDVAVKALIEYIDHHLGPRDDENF